MEREESADIVGSGLRRPTSRETAGRSLSKPADRRLYDNKEMVKRKEAVILAKV
jgi:hypothetical protein